MIRVGDAPQKGRKYKQRVGVYAILPRDGRILLTFQEAPEPEIQLPGGGIDPGESPLSALHREVFEETGWKIGPARKLGAFRRFTFMPEYDLWAEKVCHIYCARPIVALSAPTEPGHTAIWMRPELAQEAVGNPGDSHFLSQFLG